MLDAVYCPFCEITVPTGAIACPSCETPVYILATLFLSADLAPPQRETGDELAAPDAADGPSA